VFSRTLIDRYGNTPLGTYTWDDVEVFAKYRVSDKTKLDHILLRINDSAGLYFPTADADDIVPYTSGTWRVVGVRKDNTWSNGEDWDDDNLRATLTFQGTTSAANVGVVTVDVEWFAFRLSDEQH